MAWVFDISERKKYAPCKLQVSAIVSIFTSHHSTPLPVFLATLPFSLLQSSPCAHPSSSAQMCTTHRVHSFSPQFPPPVEANIPSSPALAIDPAITRYTSALLPNLYLPSCAPAVAHHERNKLRRQRGKAADILEPKKQTCKRTGTGISDGRRGPRGLMSCMS